MRLINKSLTESLYSSLKESDSMFEDMVWNRISEYADPEEYFLDKLTDEDVSAIAKDLRDIWDSGHFEQSDLDEVMEKYAFKKYGDSKEGITEGVEEQEYVLKYWESEADRDEGFSETEYITAATPEEAMAKAKEMYYDNSWASCELGKPGDEEVEFPMYGLYSDVKAQEVRYDENGVPMNENVTVTAGSTYVTVDDMGVTVDDNGTSITVDGGASVNIENTEIVPEEPVEAEETTPEEVLDGVEGVENPEEVPAEGEEGTEDVIEPSEELLEPEEELEESVEEGAKKVTSEDLNSEGVNFKFKNGDKDYLLTSFWSSNEVEPEDIEPGENIEDYGAINFNIYDSEGNEVDGGLLITKEDEFDPAQLCKDMAGLCGFPETIEVEQMPNGYFADVFGIEEGLKENAGDPNTTVEVYKNPEHDYLIKDVTELDNVDTGDVRSIDMYAILNSLDESLTERYGTSFWGNVSTFLTRCGSHKKTNENYASAILDIALPKTDKLEEFNTVVSLEVYGNGALKECVITDARNHKRIERFCGKTRNVPAFLERVMVDLLYNRDRLGLTNYSSLEEDTKTLNEEVADEAYEIAEYINDRCNKDTLQDTGEGEKVLKRDDFDELFAMACREVFNLKDEDMDSFWSGDMLADKFKNNMYSGASDVFELESTVRGILGQDGFETIFETDEDRNVDEGDLVVISDVEIKEDVKVLVNEPYDDKGMNFADGRAIEKDIKRQQNHLKQHKSLGKVTKKKFDVGEEPDQKNTAGEKVEDITDTVKVEGDKKKKSPSKKKKVEESVNEDADRIVLNPVENFDFTDPYGSYYSDDNGNLYKSVSDNELYICTKAGEPLKDVDASKYILGDKALNEKKGIKESVSEYDLERVEKAYDADWKSECTPSFNYYCKECGHWYIESDTITCGALLDVIKDLEENDEADPMSHDLPSYCDNCGSADVRITSIDEIDGLDELEDLEEAAGLLDETPEKSDVKEDSEDLVDVDDELEEGATEVAIFHRKPASVDAMKQAEANGITVNKSNYKIIGTKELTGDEFDNFANHLSSESFPWLKDMYNVKDSNSGTFNCIEVVNKDDKSMTLLVDPNGYDYARYVAMKTDLAETPEETTSEEPIEEPTEEPVE